MIRRACLVCLSLLVALERDIAADDAMYNMPESVTGVASGSDSLGKMEKVAEKGTWALFCKAHPGAAWVFGEDRQLQVRRGIIPAHWLEQGTKQLGRFSGVARPGEFYVFQAAVVAGDKPVVVSGMDFGALTAGDSSISKDAFRCISLGGIGPDGNPFTKQVSVPSGSVKPLWIGVAVPEDAKAGCYGGTLRVRAGALELPLELNLRVEGAPLAAGGVDDARRLARLNWLDSTIGRSDTAVTLPFTPVATDEATRTISILGRRIILGAQGLPARYTSYYSGSNTRILEKGREVFDREPAFECVIAGKPVRWKPESFVFTRKTSVSVAWRAVSRAEALSLVVEGVMEYDGCLVLKMKVTPQKDVTLDDARLVVRWTPGVARYAMGLGLMGGYCPDQYTWKWDAGKHQDALWLGDVNAGAMLRFKGRNYTRPLVNAYYDFKPLNVPYSWGVGGVAITTDSGVRVLTATCGARTLKAGEALDCDVDWYFTPFKPIMPARHFAERYYHSPKEAGDPARLKQEGVTVINVHQGNAINPYINYPYNDDTVGSLKDLVRRAHENDIRLKVYYTTREVTQNMPEFFALLSLDGEVMMPRREGVKWPVTNRDGPHLWLQEHVGLNIVPAWRQKLNDPKLKAAVDLAVITTPDTRWNNFYLEGLEYLVKRVGIDGIYIDDTALDRNSMQRARRILDQDGGTHRRIDMHSWNHFNGLAKFANSSIVFMELYPYYDRLWHGEGFDSQKPPEYWLTEMSGLPFGLMSEMLQSGGNPWRGMLFGMTQRWPWSGDPRNLWKLIDLFGIAEAEFIGWWDPACPVKTGNAAVPASVYRRDGKTMIALASWAKEAATVTLSVDWKALGLDPAKVTLSAPAVEQFHEERAWKPTDSIPVENGKGWLLIADETPRTGLLAGLRNSHRARTNRIEKMLIAGKEVTLKVPEQPAPGKPWLWVGEFAGHLGSLEAGLVARGWHIAYVRVNNQYGSPRAMEVWEKVYDELRAKYGLAARPALLGISRGGFYVTAWARLHPDRLSLLYLDNGVCDVRSWPGGFQLTEKGKGSPGDWTRYKTEFRFAADEDALARSIRPIEGLAPALSNNVLLVSVHGTADKVVPYVDNAKHLVDFWARSGGRYKVFAKERGDHHPHGLPDPAPLIELLCSQPQQGVENSERIKEKRP
jgi:pimeloyl-ACP methyl ester carboxylesterase